VTALDGERESGGWESGAAGDGSGALARRRAQANLAALVVAVTVVTAATVGGVYVADRALADITGDPAGRYAASGLADRLQTADVATHRPGVLGRRALGNLSVADATDLAPAVAGRPVRITVADRVVLERGDPEGVSVRRLVRVGARETVHHEVGLAENRTVRVNGTRRVEVTVTASSRGSVHTVRANGRVVRHAPGGIDGTVVVATRPGAATTLRFEGGPPGGTVTVTSYPVRTRTALLEVTVGAR
jgi:hypothetical protein